MALQKRDFPTEWTISCEEDEERARDGRGDHTEVQQAVAPTDESPKPASPPGPDNKNS
jgi:hypothetical protein